MPVAQYIVKHYTDWTTRVTISSLKTWYFLSTIKRSSVQYNLHYCRSRVYRVDGPNPWVTASVFRLPSPLPPSCHHPKLTQIPPYKCSHLKYGRLLPSRKTKIIFRIAGLRVKTVRNPWPPGYDTVIRFERKSLYSQTHASGLRPQHVTHTHSLY